MAKRYGANEYRYARPIAAALVEDSIFRGWFLGRIGLATDARLLHEEQSAGRSKGAENWWRSYWAGSRYPFKAECGERETDLLAMFEHSGSRIAVHVEVKAPGDRFGVKQALDYSRRAACWVGPGRAPRTVLEHDAAITALCCERNFAEMHPDEVSCFAATLTFEEIGSLIRPFPDSSDD